MAFIYIFYIFLILLIVIVVYLVIDNHRVRRTMLEVPEKLQRELSEKIKIQQKQQLKLSILWKTQKNMEEKVIEIEKYLSHLKEVPAENEFDQHTFQVMELNTKFTIDQINKSMNFIQEMKSQENK